MKGIAAGGIAVAVALGAGYWLGQTTRPPSAVIPVATGAMQSAPPPAAAQRTIIYYKDPAGKPDFSPDPKKDAEGRDYVPVYADEEAQATAGPAPAAPPPPAPTHGKGKILYYRNPMGLPDTSPVPKKDPMGMDYVPVYEGDDDSGGATFKISLDKVQKLGVRIAPVQMRQLTHTVRAVGTVQVDERRQYIVAPKFEGYVEVLHADTTGQALRQGQPLMEIYSPDLVLAQQEYVAAWKGLQALDSTASADAREAARTLVEGALQRLRNWDIPASELAKLKTRGAVSRTLALISPTTGVVLEKNVISGQRFMPGEVLYRIADLSTVWVIADVYEQELAFVRIGQGAKVTFNALPGLTFAGKVTFIYPTLSPETRTVKVRIELPNHEDHLKPALYGSVDIATAADNHEVLAVPDSALLDTGTRKIVLIDRGDGRFEPREVKTGSRADGYVEVLDGVSQGDNVVVSANFLIDAESNLRAALQSFQGH